VGDNELVSKSYKLKEMATGEQTELSRQGLLDRLAAAR
jgi:histidyl-tRNA synthetase